MDPFSCAPVPEQGYRLRNQRVDRLTSLMTLTLERRPSWLLTVAPESWPTCRLWPVLRFKTLLTRIRILLFTLIRSRIRLFDTDPDPCHFKEVMYLKQYFLYIFTWFSLSVGPTGPNQQAYIVKFSIPVNFVVLIRVAYRSGSYNTRELIPDPDPGKWKGSWRIRIRNTDYDHRNLTFLLTMTP